MFYESIHKFKIKTSIKDDDFFEKDFTKRFNHSVKMNSSITKNEILPSYIDFLERKLEKYTRKGYIPFAQIIINLNRYIKWANSQLPIEEREINSSRLEVICSTSTFAHIFNELIYKNYVVGYKKSKDSEINIRATARIIKKSFLILQTDGKTEIGDDHLAQELRDCSLTNKKALTLPPNK